MKFIKGLITDSSIESDLYIFQQFITRREIIHELQIVVGIGTVIGSQRIIKGIVLPVDIPCESTEPEHWEPEIKHR
jgi:hypothetical protein